MAKTKLIIDTDPGVDDALAITYAAMHPEIEIRGITTVFGNVSVEQSTLNAAYLVQLLGLNHVPIAKGAGKPLKQTKHSYPVIVHGHNGFGDVKVDYPENFPISPKSAAQFIVDEINAHVGEIVLLPIGPLTNIALALALDSSIATKVKQIVLMGGAAYVDGNISPTAEANIWDDPLAAQIVFSADWEIVMVGLDVTWKTQMPRARTLLLGEKSPVVGGFLQKICTHYCDFYENHMGFSGLALHDPDAVLYVTNPELFTTQRGQIDVVVDAVGAGKTIFTPEGKIYPEAHWSIRRNVQVCLQVNAEMALAKIETVLWSAP